MAGLHELSQLYEESNDLQMVVMDDRGDLQQMELGRRNREPSPGHPRNGGQLQPEEEVLMEEEGAQAMVEVVAGSPGIASRPGPRELPSEFARPEFKYNDSGIIFDDNDSGDDFDDNDSGDDFDDNDLGDDYNYPEKAQQRETTLDKARKFFQRKSNAGEAAVDGRFQMHS